VTGFSASRQDVGRARGTAAAAAERRSQGDLPPVRRTSPGASRAVSQRGPLPGAYRPHLPSDGLAIWYTVMESRRNRSSSSCSMSRPAHERARSRLQVQERAWITKASTPPIHTDATAGLEGEGHATGRDAICAPPHHGLGHTVPVPVRSAGGIRQLEVLDPHHENDIVPVILEEPDHHGALAVASRRTPLRPRRTGCRSGVPPQRRRSAPRGLPPGQSEPG
jgi:hypothetical protein